MKKATVNALPSCFFFEMIYGTHVFDFSLNISFLLRQNSSVFSSLYFFDMQSCLTGIEKVKTSEKNQNHVRVMYLYGMCLVFQKKRVVSYKPVCIQACLA